MSLLQLKVHFHNAAWSALVYGAKKWYMYPPHSAIMSSRQILEFIETDVDSLAREGYPARTCVQMAGKAPKKNSSCPGT
jgi:hypothetical protein